MSPKLYLWVFFLFFFLKNGCIVAYMKLLLDKHWPRKNLWLPPSLHLPKTHPQQFLWSPGENWSLEKFIALSRNKQAQGAFGRKKAGTCQIIPCKSRAITRGPAGQPASPRCQPAVAQRLLSGSLQFFLCFPPHSWRQVISRASWQPLLGAVAREPGVCLQWLQPCLALHRELYSVPL